MSDYLLMREDAPIPASIWSRIDEMVVTVVKKILVGRRFLNLVGPLGWGVEVAPLFGFTDIETMPITEEKGNYLPLVELRQEFALRARQLAIAEQTPFGLDLGAAALAATRLAHAEDGYILGALSEDAAPWALGDWGIVGGPFGAIAAAEADLLAKGFDGPYALVLGPAMYARLVSLMDMGRREYDLVQSIVTLGIYQSVAMPDNQALVVSPQPWNVDLVVGQDVVTAWIGNEGLDQRFRAFETLLVRIKRPGASRLLQ